GLNHPSIVAVYDTGDDTTPEGRVPFIVMEYVDGRTLRDVLGTEKRLEPNWAMEVVSEVCAALDFSHRHGIIHRDIKPANVMITKAGAVKVMDFGIARAVADNAATVTQTAAVIGTAQYLSPEQARGEPVDARSDVYSTGCLLYELVVGHPPFQGDSPVAVAYQHVRESAPVPSTVNPEVPRALDSIVMKALAKNPLNRYQSAGDMRADLQRALADRPVNAEPVLSDDERTQLIAASAGGRPGNGSGLLPVAGAEVPNSRRGALIWTAAVLVLLLVIAGSAYALLHKDKKEVAAPPATTSVPSLVGLAQTAAVAKVKESKLVVDGTPEMVRTCAVPVALSSVCSQNPAPDSVVNVNTGVTMTIYIGPEMKQVPFVEGLQIADATDQLTKLGFQPVPTAVSSSKAAGIVVKQTPANGTSLAVGMQVALEYSSGQLVVPDVTGKTFVDAAQMLNNAGFKVNQTPVAEPNTDPTKNALVSRTDPAKGSPVDASTTTITVYVYATAVTCTPASPAPSGTSTKTPTPTPTPTATPTC
ncbi:MAG: Serine/threonine-protein kinaselike domain, partial [Pseudonocardiales bacterium]|nr:Serine/threonine-protein kinaselike domain [Pseudonocardiales bacterium]